MFVRRIPYQSVRRRRIRHWLLLLLRVGGDRAHRRGVRAAVPRRRRACGRGRAGGAREVVILLDQSASMGYGDHWQRAQEAARDVVRRLGAGDRATLVLFARTPRRTMRATPDRGRLEGAIDAREGDGRRDALRPGAEARARASSPRRRCRAAKRS